jgi:formylglycine-generating enzyme required for sulfatase activity
MMRGVFFLTGVFLAGTGLAAEGGARAGAVRVSAGVNEGRDPDFGNYVLNVGEPFHMDATEVTWGLWCDVRDWAVTNGYEDLAGVGVGKADDHPVQGVNWFACIRWCNARSEKEGLIPCYHVGGVVCRRSGGAPDCSFAASGYRLPTHVEWEYAARGGLVSKRYPWGDTITYQQANYYSHANNTNDMNKTHGHHPDFGKDDPPFTSPVASFAPNGFGLYDMAGNVWEWCWAPKGASRTFRGGSWDGDANGVRCGFRSENSGNGEQSVYGGFRCVRRAGQ